MAIRFLSGQGVTGVVSAFSFVSTTDSGIDINGIALTRVAANSAIRVADGLETLGLLRSYAALNVGTTGTFGGNVGIGKSPGIRLDVDSAGTSDIARFGNNNGSFVLGQTANLSSIDLPASNAFRIRQAGSIPFIIGTTGAATFTGLVSGITPTAAANFATKAYVDANSGGTVTKSGTPVNNQLAVWTSSSNIEGEAELTYDGNTFSVGGSGNTSTFLDVIGTNTAGAPATSAAIRIYGYEGRGEGIFYYDSAYSGKEWYSGLPYSGGDTFQIGYDASGNQAQYTNNGVLRIFNTGQIQFNNYGQSNFSGTVTTFPAFAGDGQIVDRTPAQVLSDIGGAPASGSGSYLPVNNPTFTGVLTGPDVIATTAFRAGVANAWKIRPNNSNSELAFEYSTSSGLSDANIKLKLESSGNATFTGDVTVGANLKSTGQNLKFFAAGTNVMNIDINGKVYPNTDNAYDLGHSVNLAWRNLYLSGALQSRGGATFAGNLSAASGIFNSGTTNVVASFTSTDGIAGIALIDNGGNVELSASGNTFRVQPAGGAAALTVTSTTATFAGNVLATNGYVQGGSAFISTQTIGGTGYAMFGSNSSSEPIAIGRDGTNLDITIDTSGNTTFAGNVQIADGKYLELGALYLQDGGAGRIGFNRDTSNGSIHDSTYNAFQLQINTSGSTGKLEIQGYNGSGGYIGSTFITGNGLIINDYITHNGDDNTFFGFSGQDVFKVTAGNSENIYVDINGANFRYQGGQRLGTTATGIAVAGAATATTATIGTSSDATLTTKGYVDGLVTGVPVYKGTWDASGTAGGTPDLRLAVNKVLGNYYIVSTAGSATPNGAGTEPNSWNVGDWCIFSDVTPGAGTDLWQKIDNTSVISGAGTGLALTKWAGTLGATSETLTDSLLTDTGTLGYTTSNSELFQLQGTTASGYAEIDIGNNLNDKIVIGSIGSTYTAADWAGSTYIYNNGTGKKMYMKSIGDMQFFTGGYSITSNIRMTITAGGNVGIGITTPGTLNGASYGTTKLHVDGGTDRGQVIIEGDAFAGVVMSDNGATTNQKVFATSVDDGKYTIKPLNDNGTSTSGGVAVAVLHGGNVGIGLTDPTSKLTVGNGNIELSDTSYTNIPEIKSTASSGGGRYVTGAIKFDEKNNFNGEIQFWTTPSSSGYVNANANHAQRMVIAQDGKVGIGAPSPDALLEIAGSTEQRYLQVDAIAGFAGLGSGLAGMVEFTNAGDGNNVVIKTNNSVRTDAAPLSVYTGSISRFVIRNDGNVGIGTTNPDSKLKVEENANSGLYSIFVKNPNAGSSAFVSKKWQNNDSGFGEIWRNSSTRGLAGQGVSSFNMYNSNDINFWSSGSHTMALVSNKVGIGLVNPSSILHVRTSTDHNIEFEEVSSELRIAALNDARSANIGLQFAASQFNFISGNVGIGSITAPREMLDVQGKTYIEAQGINWNQTTPGGTTGTIHLDPVGNGADNTGCAITFGASDNNAGGNAHAGIYTRTDGSYGSKMYFATTDSYAVGSKTRMMIDYNGNVGIGTTAPETRLHVVGPGGFVNPPNYSVFDVTVENSGQADIGIIGTQYSGVYFGDAATPLAGGIVYYHTDDSLTLRTGGNVHRVTISNAGAVKFNAYGAGYLKADASGNITAAGASQVGPFLPLAGGTMIGDINMGDNDVIGIDELKFTSGTRMYDGAGTNYLVLQYANSGGGGIRVEDANDGVQGYLYADGNATSSFGLLDGTGSWAVRCLEGQYVELRYNNAAKLQTTNTGISVTGDITIDSALLSQQDNTDVSGSEVVAQVAIATYTAAFFDFVIKKGTNVRSGTVYACHDGTNVKFTETSTQDLGDTSDVALSVNISGGQMRLLADAATTAWSVKSLIRAI